MILIYSNTSGPRLTYACNFIFNTFLGIPFKIIQDKNPPLNENTILINYSGEVINNSQQIFPSGLLDETKINPSQPEMLRKNKTPVLFPEKNSFTGFDIFSAVFYMLSRYEEYQEFKADHHGRFPATASLAFKNNFLAIPVVDIWITEFADTLKKINPSIKISEKKFSYHSTIDIDNAFAYKGKAGIRKYGAMAKSFLNGKTEEIRTRAKVLSGKLPDPYDAYDFQIALSEKTRVPLTYFVLYTQKNTYDTSLPPGNTEMDKLVRKLASRANLGIHPSYYSSEQTEKLAEEIKQIGTLINKPVNKSRQHFLRMRFPATLRALMQNSITEEYSMGFSTHNGFRAGTSCSFNFYDLQKDEETNLLMVPFHVMDSVFYDQQKVSAEEAISEILSIAEEVMKVKGDLVSVWHDRSFDEKGFPGWKKNYIKLHEFCTGVTFS